MEADLQPFGSMLFFQTISGHPRQWETRPSEHHLLQSRIFAFYLQFSNKEQRGAALNDPPSANSGCCPQARPCAGRFLVPE
jgi:hypothetical protein